MQTTRNNLACGIILHYHRIAHSQLDPWGLRVSPENFEEQLSFLREFGQPISLPNFVASYQTGTAPKRSIVITFDDGYVDNYSGALPLLKKFDVPATFFISTGYTGEDYFWWEALEHVFLRPNHLPAELILKLNRGSKKWGLDSAAYYSREQYESDCIKCRWKGETGSRIRLYHEVYEALWSLGHAERLMQLKEIIMWARIDPHSFADSRPMTVEEIKSLGDEKLITIGAHSVNHLPLDGKGKRVQEAEILDSQRFLRKVTNKAVVTFAYPHGKFDSQSVGILTKSCFICACSTQEKMVDSDTTPFLLPRFAVQNWRGDVMTKKLEQWLG